MIEQCKHKIFLIFGHRDHGPDLLNRANCKTAPMGGENYAGDLLTMCTLKNTGAARSFP